MDDGNGVLYTEAYRGSLNYAIIYNLTSGTSYSFKVSAVNFNGEGSTSSATSIKSCVAPSGVVAPTKYDSSSTTISLRWS